MNTKLTVLLLSGLSVFMAAGAFTVSADASDDYMNWSYAMGETPAVATESQIIVSESDSGFVSEPADVVLAQSEPMAVETTTETEALTLTYVDEAEPLVFETPKNPVTPKKKCKSVSEMGLKAVDPAELNPQYVTDKTFSETQLDTTYIQRPVRVQYPITRQYPIDVQYPVSYQRDVTIEQPVVLQQPVIVRRPVIMQQAVTVQRQPAFVQQQPVIMQHQPTVIQQKPVVMQAPQSPVMMQAPQSQVIPVSSCATQMLGQSPCLANPQVMQVPAQPVSMGYQQPTYVAPTAGYTYTTTY